MKADQFSETAIGVASLRAHHSEHDRPIVFDDPYAARLLSDEERARAYDQLPLLVADEDRKRSDTIDDPDQREAALLRALPFVGPILVTFRCVDDWLRQAFDDGVLQCVVLGAGLDSTSLRYATEAGPLRIFEVDHPATQDYKRRRLAAEGLVPRPNTAFVPVDFNTMDLAERLREAGFHSDRATVFSWINVTYYLKPDAVLRTFETLRGLAPPDSQVLFDLYETDAARSPAEQAADARMDALVRSLGEPPESTLTAVELAPRLRAMGYDEVELLRPEDIEPWHRTTRGLGYGFMPGCWVARARW